MGHACNRRLRQRFHRSMCRVERAAMEWALWRAFERGGAGLSQQRRRSRARVCRGDQRDRGGRPHGAHHPRAVRVEQPLRVLAACDLEHGAECRDPVTLDPDVALELLLAWNRVRCRPPLDDTEVARVVASITKLHDVENAFEQERIGSDEFGLLPKAP